MIKHHRPSTSSGVRTIGILIAVISVLYLAREILISLAFAITLALILTPAVVCLQKIRVERVPAVGLVMVVAIAAAGGIGWVIFDQLVGVANELPRYQQNIHNKLESMRTPGKGAVGRATASVQALGKELANAPVTAPPAIPADRTGRRSAANLPARPLAVEVVAQPANEVEYVADLVKPFLAPLGTVGIVLIFSVFLLIKEQDLRNRLFRLVGLNRMNIMTQALDDATHRVSRYLLMQFLVNACFGVLCGTGLYFIGIPYAALWGCVAGILRIVPYAGAVVSALLPFTLSLAVFNSWTPPLLVFLLFATLELATGNIIEPMLYGAHTGISALALLLSTVFWTALWGPAGLILSTPLTVCVVVLGRYQRQLLLVLDLFRQSFQANHLSAGFELPNRLLQRLAVSFRFTM
jgi:predicted PurR-regulated permease PerM